MGTPVPQRDQRITSALSEWFTGAARPLPWRRSRSGYSALVAEMMLQQTQVSRVVERYERFMERFPTVADLAAADEQQVLSLWQGLGYYTRARHLHAAARVICAEHAGAVPSQREALLRLPGVGPYTAGAITSIVFNQPEPIVDGNVARVLARLDAHRGNGEASHRWAWRRAGQLVAQARSPGRFNEALMELGSLICTPGQPDCARCPLAGECRAHERGVAHRIPPPRAAAARQVVHFHSVIVRRGGTLLLEQRPPTGLWAGLWQCPTVEHARPLRPGDVRNRFNVALSNMRRLGRFDHPTSHRAVTFHVFTASCRARRGEWRTTSETAELPMSSAQRRVLAMIESLP